MLAAFIYLGFSVQRYMEALQERTQNDEVSTNDSGELIDDEMTAKLATLEAIIEKYYYQDDVSKEDLEIGIYRGLLDAVGDPYTVYYTPEEIQDLYEQTEGIYYGIGAYVALDETTNRTKILSPIPGTPAEEAGLRADDILYEVDGVDTYDMDINNVVSLIKGEEGTTVSLTIYREGEPDFLYVDVERRKVEAPTVEFEMLEDGMAYIQITEFDEVTVDQFAEALAEARASEMKGLIIDVRANPGGSLDAVVNICQMLLPKGMIVYTEDKYGSRSEYTCDGKREFDLPLVLLIDGNSASASEILAGAIQDYEIGTLVGTTTFGKGIVQQVVNLRDGSAVKITVSSYYTPSGRNIHGTGIEPDVEVIFDGERYYSEEAFDNQLDKAKEVLRDLIEKDK
ncbi:MAG: S41 family peptidase [Lachnospiraceae bacterium]|nr:S41 family peptidase [Lachnospiraceae bacterium]